MRIGIDARLLSYRRGMGNYVHNLLVELEDLDKENEYVLYTDRPFAGAAAGLKAYEMRVLLAPIYPVWEQVALPLAAVRDDLDILHCPANTGPLCLPKDIKLVVTVHDVMYMLPTSIVPSSSLVYQRLGRLYRRLVVPWAARRADVVTTDSGHSRQDILRYLDVEEGRLIVVWGASSRAYRVVTDADILAQARRKYGLDSPFIMALAGTDPRKNTRRVIEAFALLRDNASTECQLALVGLPSSAQRRFRQHAWELGIADDVVFTGFIPEQDLVALYNLAQAFVYPSLYEGFGLPVLEAMACGTSVITSSRGSIPEIAADAALFVDPTDHKAIYEGIARILSDRDLAERLRIQGLDRVRMFSWRTAAAKMLEVYQHVVRLS